MADKTNEESEWTTVLRAKRHWWNINLKEIWAYKDLIALFVRRDFVAYYKQTILGPLWFLIQPLFTTVVFTVIFGRIANIPTNGVPPMLFYMAGVVCWNYFAECLNKTSNTFVSNAAIFGKVYFPRLVTPISVTISNLVTFLIQFALFMSFWMYFASQGADIHISSFVWFLPLLVLQMACLGLGVGIIVSSLTTRYRDLTFAVGFGVQLWMYATPVVYPLSEVHGKLRTIVLLNPMTPVVETFKGIFLGTGTIDGNMLLYSWAQVLVILLVGMVMFSRVEKNFMDTV
jgi:lipopolysaccharide transport system permease protein